MTGNNNSEGSSKGGFFRRLRARLNRGELVAGEDAPRPAAGFRSVDDTQVASPGLVFAIVIGLLALVVASIVWRRSRRRPAPPDPGPSPRERLEELSGDAEPSVLVAAIGPLLRAAAAWYSTSPKPSWNTVAGG